MDEIFYEGRRYVTTKRAAYILGVKRGTVAKWARTGKIRATKVGRHVYVGLSAVMAAKAQRGQPQSAQARVEQWIRDHKITVNHSSKALAVALQRDGLCHSRPRLQQILSNLGLQVEHKYIRALKWMREHPEAAKTLTNERMRPLIERDLKFSLNTTTVALARRIYRSEVGDGEQA